MINFNDKLKIKEVKYKKGEHEKDFYFVLGLFLFERFIIYAVPWRGRPVPRPRPLNPVLVVPGVRVVRGGPPLVRR